MSDNSTPQDNESKLIVKNLALEDLARSGLTEEHAERLNIQYLTPSETKSRCGMEYPSYEIPYENISRLRLLPKPSTAFGSAVSQPKQRYWQPADTVPELYKVPGYDYAGDTLVITEGEKKAASACLLGNIPTVGIGGVWNFQAKKQSIDLLPAIKNLINDKKVYHIVPDGDFRTNRMVHQAVMSHAEAVLRYKPDIKVYMVELPEDGENKMGLDDYLLLPDADYWQLPKKRLSRMDIAGTKQWEMSDRGFANAALFVYDDLYYIAETGTWFEFTDHGWIQEDDYAAASRLAKIVDARIMGAQSIEDDKARNKLINYLVSCNNFQKTQLIINTWKQHPKMKARLDEWDADDIKLGTTNGIVNLETGQLSPFTRCDRTTLRTRCKYDCAAEAPLWEQTLNEIFQGNQELVNLMQRWYGYSLTGLTTEQKIMVQVGRGRNGKSLINDVIGYVMGDYHKSTSFDTFTTSKFGNDNTKSSALAQMIGRRFITASETANTRYLDTSSVKTVTGDAYIQAKELYKKAFTYRFTGKIVMMTNHAPQVRDDSEGIWERIVNVDFARVFSRDEIDMQRMAKLKEEKEGILNWLVRGAIMYLEDGLQIPDSVRASVQEWRDSEDELKDFAEQRLTFAEGTYMLGQDLFDAWKDYCDNNNRPTAWSRIYFTRQFLQRFPQCSKNPRFRPLDGQRSSTGQVNQVTAIIGVRGKNGSVSQLDSPPGAVIHTADRQADAGSTDGGE